MAIPTTPAEHRAGSSGPAVAAGGERIPVSADPREVLLAVLISSDRLLDLDLQTWDVLLPAARTAGVLTQLAMRAHEQHLGDRLPKAVRPHLESAQVLAKRHRVVVEWEIGRIERALRHLDTRVVLLKGAAYQAIGLDTAAGRLTCDVDILVPHEQLPAVEEALTAAGWHTTGLDLRDQAYFRRWLHELPPLIHTRRKTLIDVHHAILPPTDRLLVDTQLLLDASVALPGRRVRVLAPVDMFVHSAAHLFRNGRWAHAVRDLADMDAMVRRFSEERGFWDELQQRADQLNLRIPCAGALDALDRYFGTPIPEPVRRTVAPWQPRWALRALRNLLVDRALFPRHLNRRDRRCEHARSALACWPLPRVEAMRTALFWTKRFRERRRDVRNGGGAQTDRLSGPAGRPDEIERHD